MLFSLANDLKRMIAHEVLTLHWLSWCCVDPLLGLQPVEILCQSQGVHKGWEKEHSRVFHCLGTRPNRILFQERKEFGDYKGPYLSTSLNQ